MVYQDLYDRAKKIVKKEKCITFYDVARPLYHCNVISLKCNNTDLV